MSRIDELLAELAPEGVARRALGDLCSIRSGGTPSSGNPSYYDGSIPWCAISDITTATKYIRKTQKSITELGLANSSAKVFATGTLLLSIYASLGEVAISATPMATNQAILGLVPNVANELSVDYLYYVMKGSRERLIAQRQKGSQNNLNKSIVSGFEIPVPPIEVQREIARVLDSFNSLEQELVADLEAELEARRRQHAFYRDAQFAVEELSGVRLLPLNELGQFVRGRRFTKSDVVDDGIPSIHYGEIYTTYGIATTNVISHIRRDLGPQLRYAKPGDVVIAAVGETVEDVGKGVAWLGTTEVAIHDDCFLYRSTLLDPKYLSYYLRTTNLIRAKDKYVSRAKMKRMSSDGLGRLEIPVLPIEEQRRVVAVLDKYGALVDDLVASIPAEAAARRKQYQYYRDRLLTFKELVA